MLLRRHRPADTAERLENRRGFWTDDASDRTIDGVLFIERDHGVEVLSIEAKVNDTPQARAAGLR
jgi:hypothetical protein